MYGDRGAFILILIPSMGQAPYSHNTSYSIISADPPCLVNVHVLEAHGTSW